MRKVEIDSVTNLEDAIVLDLVEKLRKEHGGEWDVVLIVSQRGSNVCLSSVDGLKSRIFANIFSFAEECIRHVSAITALTAINRLSKAAIEKPHQSGNSDEAHRELT